MLQLGCCEGIRSTYWGGKKVNLFFSQLRAKAVFIRAAFLQPGKCKRPQGWSGIGLSACQLDVTWV